MHITNITAVLLVLLSVKISTYNTLLTVTAADWLIAMSFKLAVVRLACSIYFKFVLIEINQI